MQRVTWQARSVFKKLATKDFSYKLITSTKVGPDDMGQSMQKRLLKEKRDLGGLFAAPTGLAGLNFFKISGQRALFRKRKNVNLNFMSVARVPDT